MTLTITLQNIGGIDELTLNFRQGKNLITAPNAIGKSSFVRGIELLNMPGSKISKRRYYFNLFTKSSSVKLDMEGYGKAERHFNIDGKKITVVGDTFHPENQKVNLFSLATPDNKLITSITTGRNLEELLTQYSDVKYYSYLISVIKNRLSNLKKDLRIYLVYESDVENLRKERSNLERELSNAEKDRKSLPKINLEEIKSLKDSEARFQELTKEVANLKNMIEAAHDIIKLDKARIRDQQKLSDRMEEEIKNFMNDHPRVEQEISHLVTRTKETRKFLQEVKQEKRETEKAIKEVRNWISLSRSMDLSKCIICGRPYSEKNAKNREDKLLVEDSHQSKRMREYEFQIDDLERRKEDLELQVHRIKNDNQLRINKAQKEIRRLNREMQEKEEEIDSSKKTLEIKSSELKILEKSIDDDLKTKIELITDLDAKIQRISGKIEQVEKQIGEKSDRMGQADLVQAEHEFYQVFQEHLESREKIVKMLVLENFNAQIKFVYSRLKFQDFEEIKIDNEFRLIVRRKRRGATIDQPIESLSDSERITIALICMLAGREEYVKDYPIFCLDKVTLDYDPSRFSMILDYLVQRGVPYILVTAAKSIEDSSGQLEVEYL
ncbi:MAG: archaea-specific SMC-related protein [Candidatus Thorarchaeota archaeon]